MAHIQTPVKGFTGTVVGVDFKDGVGTTDDEGKIAYFERQGYDVTPHGPGDGKEPAKRTGKKAPAKSEDKAGSKDGDGKEPAKTEPAADPKE